MSKPRRSLKGRPAFDNRGNASWQSTGESDSEIETRRIKAIAEGLSLESPSQEESSDPYNQALSQPKEEPHRRLLDDMRRLSDEIKREHADLVKRLRNRISDPLARVSGLASGMLLRLRFDDRELLVDERRSGISIGRAEDNDIVLRTGRASRLHARIEISGNKLVLIDVSMNGTYVQIADKKAVLVSRDRLLLEGEGMIGFGRRPMPGSRHTVHFTCERV